MFYSIHCIHSAFCRLFFSMDKANFDSHVMYHLDLGYRFVYMSHPDSSYMVVMIALVIIVEVVSMAPLLDEITVDRQWLFICACVFVCSIRSEILKIIFFINLSGRKDGKKMIFRNYLDDDHRVHC